MKSIAEIQYHICEKWFGDPGITLTYKYVLIRTGFLLEDDVIHTKIPDVDVAEFDDENEALLFRAYLEQLQRSSK